MRQIQTQEGSQAPSPNFDIEAIIGNREPEYVKDNVPTGGTDILRIECYVIHNFGTVNLEFPADVEFKESHTETGGHFFYGRIHGADIHLARGLNPFKWENTVNAQVRIKTAYPVNRPTDAKRPAVSYNLVLELTPAVEETGPRIVLEKANGDLSVWVIDPKRELFVLRGACVKRVPANYQPRPAPSDNGGGRRVAQGGLGRRGFKGWDTSSRW